MNVSSFSRKLFTDTGFEFVTGQPEMCFIHISVCFLHGKPQFIQDFSIRIQYNGENVNFFKSKIPYFTFLYLLVK